MTLRTFTQEPPLREPITSRDNKATRAWHVWLSYVAARLGKALIADVAVDPASLTALARQASTVTVPGVAVGDFAIASFVPADPNVALLAHVTAADTVTVWFLNLSAATTVDLPAGTLRIRVEKL